jgi:pimeloyl-ACP methyl ester carboxylesterase
VRALPDGIHARVASYPVDQLLGYDDLLTVLEPPPGRFALVAESFAGPLAIRLAASRPADVSALVLVATFARCPRKLAARLGASLGGWCFRVRPPRTALRLALAGWGASDAELDFLRATIRLVSPRVLAYRLAEIVRVDVGAEWASLTVPTLYLAGTRDRLVGPRTVAELQRLRLDLEVEHLDAPHLLLQVRPVESAARVARFLRAQCT